MCKHNRLITHYRLNNTKTVRQGAKGCGSTLAKHEILHFSQWPKKHLAQHHAKLPFPHHVCNKENGSP